MSGAKDLISPRLLRDFAPLNDGTSVSLRAERGNPLGVILSEAKDLAGAILETQYLVYGRLN